MRNAELTKNTILRKSGALFNSKGYKATSLSHITLATGFTKGAIYRHFQNKEQLEKESLSFLSNIMFEKVGAVIRLEKTAGNKLKALFLFFETYVSKPVFKGGCPLLNAAIEADDSNPLLRKEALKILNTLSNSIESILTKGKKYKQISPEIDVEFYTTLIIASLEGAIMMGRLKKDGKDIKFIIRHLEEQIRLIEI